MASFDLGATVSTATRRLGAWGEAGAARARDFLGEARLLARRVSAIELKPQLARLREAPRSLALPFSHDEREVLALLFLPMLLVASAIVAHQSVRTLKSYVTSITIPDQEIASLRPSTEGVARPATATPTTARQVLSPRADLSPARAEPQHARVVAAPPAPLAPIAEETPLSAAASGDPLAPAASAASALPPAALPAPTPTAQGESDVALLAPPPGLTGTKPASLDPLSGYEADDDGKPIMGGICTVEEAHQRSTRAVSYEPVPAGSEAFGRRLAEAAQAQLGGLVVYNDAYRSLRYPMGDVNRFFGVCTDVVVRAYRALGVDLQALVHQTRTGRGDTNIDHRRTEVLRRFFAAHGETLPITAFPEDYRPGDIVTYYRPQNRGSRNHIAIVSNVMAPSGRPMIVHNRGWGPELEDALFVDEITGHYRYNGPGQTRNADAANPNGKGAGAAAVIPASFSPAMRDPSLHAE